MSYAQTGNPPEQRRPVQKIPLLGNRTLLQFQKPETACALLIQPGDLILQHFKKGDGEYQLFGGRGKGSSNEGETSQRAPRPQAETPEGSGWAKSVTTSALMRLGQLLSLRNLFESLHYGHTEVIYKMEHRGKDDIVTWSFYPSVFQKHVEEADKKDFERYDIGNNPDYRKNYSVFRARAFTDRGVLGIREKAISRLHRLEIEFLIRAIIKQEAGPKDDPVEIRIHLDAALDWLRRFHDRVEFIDGELLLSNIEQELAYNLSQGGKVIIENTKRVIQALREIKDSMPYFSDGFFSNCADFGNWALGNQLTTWWNVVPGLRSILSAVYPPEAIDNPNALADSIFAKKTCEVKDGETVIYPKDVLVQDILDGIEFSLESIAPENRTHAHWVRNILLDNEITYLQSKEGSWIDVPIYEYVRLESGNFLPDEVRKQYENSQDQQSGKPKCKKTPGPFLFGLEGCSETLIGNGGSNE